MKIKFYALLAGIIMVLGANTTKAQSIIANGDFETWTAGVPDSWTTIETGITIAEETTNIHSGSTACNVLVTTATQGNTDFRQDVDVVAGTTYDVSLWVYQVDTTANVTLYIGTFTNLYSDRLLQNQWQEMTYTYEALVTQTLTIGTRYYDQNGFDTQAELIIDDFSMTPQIVTEPTVTIISPLDGSTVSSSDVTVEFVTQNFVVAEAGLGDGHIHYYVDGAMTMYYSTDPILLPGLSEGAHEVILKLVDDSHADLVPSVADTVNFTVTLPTEVATIADLRAQPQGGIYTLTGEAFVTYARTPRNQKYIQDATAGILIDDNPGVITTTYVIGDGMTGVTGTLSSFNEVLQFLPASDPGAPSSSGNVTVPEVVTLADLNANQSDYESELILLEGISFNDAGANFTYNANFTVTQGAEPGTFRTQFSEADYIGTEIPAFVNVTALGSGFYGAAQFVARDLNDFEIAVMVPVNNTCDGATITDVSVGTLASATGDGTGATASAGFPVAEVWEAFTLSECADVTIDFCGSVPMAPDLYINLFDACPIGASLPVGDVTLIECAGNDSSVSIFFPGLDAGTYYYPVVADMDLVGGFAAYTINYNAVSCEPASDTCSTFLGGPWTDFNSTFGGAPVAVDGVCPFNEITAFEVWASEAYTVDGFVNGETYTFSMCNGSYGAWAAELSVWDENGDIVVFLSDTCSISWTATYDGTYVIGINEVGACGDASSNTSTDNGFPALTCEGANSVEDITLADFTVYPNPNSGQFSIVNEGVSGNYIIELIDVTGKVVYSEQVQMNSNARTEINSTDVNTGVYLVKMTNTDENYYRTLRMIVK